MMERAQLVETLNTSVEEHAFSGVISIRHQGRVLYERAAGYADRSNKVENTLETRFGIASGTKFFTALAVGKLIAAQRLSFSTKLKDCLTLPFPRYSPEITIRHLLTHTSGIPDYYDEEKVTDFDHFTLAIPWYALKGPRDYLAVFPEEAMKFAPGERFSYSNGGYILLGVVIEERTGLKYQEFVEQAIFKPVGMNRSGYFALNQLPEKTALGYVEEEGGWRTNIYNLPIVGASDGGAFTTVQDMATLWKAFWGGEILPKELVDIYATPCVKAEQEKKSAYYGHGLWLSKEVGGKREVYITGCDAGVSFKASVNREADLQVTVMSNTTHGAWPVLRDIDRALRN
jgi:CubicO group peptidase (beta-lactamase class C family)